MTCALIEEAGGRYRLELHGEPSYCRALAMAPPELEAELSQGVWLVLAVAVWSGPDRAAVNVALAAAKQRAGEVQLGVRPFDDHQELETWFPGEHGEGSPLWVILRGGQAREVKVGVRPLEDVVASLRRALAPG